MFCSSVLAFGIGGSKTPVAFKMKLIVTKVNDWKLLLLPQKGSTLYVAAVLDQPLKSIDKLRKVQYRFSPPQYTGFNDRILFLHALTDNRLFSELLY